MMLEALQRFTPEIYDSVNWVVLLDASEETLSEDFGALCLDRLDGAAACLVFEGGYFQDGNFRLVRSRKGMAKYELHVEGKASHAGVAHADGANAIVALAEAVRAIASYTDYEREITFNIGFASGGTVPNRVPHQAEALGEMRAFDRDVFAEGLARLTALAGTHAGCRTIVDVIDTTEPWQGNSETDRLLQIWSETADELGYRVFPEARGGLSDGNHTWRHIPTLDGLGPGGGNAHCSEHQPEAGKEQEYLYAPSLVPKAVLNTLAVLRLVGTSS
jgi:glutamate carboxypeptidase